MSYYPIKSIMVIGTDHGNLVLLHVDTGSTAVLGGGHGDGMVHAVCFAHQRGQQGVQDHGILLSGGSDGGIAIWEMSPAPPTPPHLVTTFAAHPGAELTALVHEPASNIIVSGASDGSVHVSGQGRHRAPLYSPCRPATCPLAVGVAPGDQGGAGNPVPAPGGCSHPLPRHAPRARLCWEGQWQCRSRWR